VIVNVTNDQNDKFAKYPKSRSFWHWLRSCLTTKQETPTKNHKKLLKYKSQALAISAVIYAEYELHNINHLIEAAHVKLQSVVIKIDFL